MRRDRANVPYVAGDAAMTPKARSALVKQARESREAAISACDGTGFQRGYRLGLAHGIERSLKADKGKDRK